MVESNFKEVGSSGLEAYSGFIAEAYNRELDWPGVAPLYNRIWRSDPELSIVRLIFDSWSAQQTITATVPDEIPGKDLGEPTDDDQRAADFYQSVLEDLDGGINRWLSSCVSRVPFYGWGWWEVLPAIRDPKWHAPGDDPWRSEYDDGLIGFRRFAFRRYSSFDSWELDNASGRWTGMSQLDSPNPPVTIPLDRSLHVLFGDMDNPEGLATMEALWRLERYKWNLELIQGMGYEHSAGHAKFEATKQLDETDNTLIRKAARAVASVQEGNYISLPEHIKFNYEDVPFAAGANILSAVRYYSVLKLAIWGMQWVSIATLADTGSYSAIKDASEGAINIFNSMAKGFVSQVDEQVGTRLFGYSQNAAAFPGMTRRPRLSISPVRKSLTLEELGTFGQAMAAIMPLSVEDMNAIREKSGILPPMEDQPIVVEEPEPLEGEETETDEIEDEGLEDEAELAFRPFVVSDREQPITLEHEAEITEKDINRAVRAFEKWAEENDPAIAGLLRSEIVEPSP